MRWPTRVEAIHAPCASMLDPARSLLARDLAQEVTLAARSKLVPSESVGAGANRSYVRLAGPELFGVAEIKLAWAIIHKGAHMVCAGTSWWFFCPNEEADGDTSPGPVLVGASYDPYGVCGASGRIQVGPGRPGPRWDLAPW